MADLKTIYQEVKVAMFKPISVFEEELKKVRGARASSSLVDNIKVEYYNKVTPLKNIASISTPDARTIVISPYDKGVLSAIEKAIQKENLNLNPSNDGKIIRLVLPQLTEETRKDTVKLVKTKAEESKVAIRNIRREYIDKLKKLEKDGELTEDERKEGEEKIQDYTNKAIKKIDQIFKDKEKEIMTV